ncbi:hypothetical protein TPHA_0O01990 [Tetrapisispora phaffii CBS 4417]|uniref:Autophagy-related protein 2 n=1 Tax=Tetrapisispora phaffii (strain ATCC 24235 / CBS 4417 / NBRC 1672 / NRRL Y-8282 / UCD 70-5) TaxID=1071381 RepID=G8C1Y7_TETPH|nr:hypothetical protein TPHA_0O01990 [Tetrapisispora phaffii CBS 4417]CCE66165.1 hypothetical protein TPHA_0O01990 [Tetrapisispora phaffii CBS 4417]
MPFGFTGSIQKKILAYILNKISILSNVDLSDVDISLGPNSKFTFHKVKLNTDDIKVTNFIVQEGSLDELDIQLTISAVLNIVARNMTVIIKSEKDLLHSVTANQDDGQLLFSLSKSLNDLTTSMMLQLPTSLDLNALEEFNEFEDDTVRSNDATDTELAQTLKRTLSTTTNDNSGHSNIDGGNANSKGTQSTLQMMKKKVLSSFLSKFKLNIIDVKIIFQLDDANENYLEIKVDDILLTNDEMGTRELTLQTLKIYNARKNSSKYSGSPLAQTSMVDSMSMYMSAMETFESTTSLKNNRISSSSIIEAAEQTINILEILSIEGLSLKLTGFNAVDDFKFLNSSLTVKKVSLYYYNLLNLEPALFTLLLRNIFACTEKENDSKVQSPEKFSNYRRFQQEQNISISVNKFTLLLLDFELMISEHLSLKFENFHLSSSEFDEYEINIQSLEPVKVDSKIQKKNNDCNSVMDVLKIKYSSNNAIIDVTKDLEYYLDKTAILDILSAYIKTNALVERYRKVNCYTALSSKAPLNIELKTKTVNIYLLLDNEKLKFELAPIQFTSSDTKFQLNNIEVYRCLINNDTDHILTIKNIEGRNRYPPIQILSQNTSFKKSSIFTNLLLSIDGFYIKESYPKLHRTIKEFMSMAFEYESTIPQRNDNVNHKSCKRSVRVLNCSNIKLRETKNANLVLKIKTVQLDLHQFLNSKFGSLNLSLKENEVIVNEDGELNLCSIKVTASRHFDNSSYSLVKSIAIDSNTLPAIIVNKLSTNKIQIIMKNMEFVFCASFMELLENHKVAHEHEKPNHSVNEKLIIEARMTYCSLILKPFRIKPALLIFFNDIHLNYNTANSYLKCNSTESGIFLIDDISQLKNKKNTSNSCLSDYYYNEGFINIGKFNLLSAQLKFKDNGSLIKISSELLQLSLCSDSFHTLLFLLIDFKIPLTFPDNLKYKNDFAKNINTMKDVDQSFFDPSKIRLHTDVDNIQIDNDGVIINEFLDQSYPSSEVYESGIDALPEWESTTSSLFTLSNSLECEENYMDNISSVHSSRSTQPENLNIDFNINRISIKFFDGYDWKYTRKQINKTINIVGNKVMESEQVDDTQIQLQTTVFDSILIATTKSDVDKLKTTVNNDIQSEKNPIQPINKANLKPSKIHKIAIEADSISIKAVVFSSITQESNNHNPIILNSFDISVDKFTVLDNVLGSTWNKFLSMLRYEKWPSSKSMLNIKYSSIKPIGSLEAVETIIDVEAAPLRLHVDQGTLDFLLRFLEFKDPRFELVDDYPELTFIQKFSSNSVKIVIDYKPKKYNYSGLRSGRSEELVNFFILEGATVTLKAINLYGVNGFERLGFALKENWVPDILSNQLSGIIGGVSSLKPAVTLGSNFKSAITVPVREYRQEGNASRSIKKGVNIFFKTTGGDFIRIGAKMVSGTQTILENTEEFFGGKGSAGRIYSIPETVVNFDSILKEDQLIGGSNPKVRNRDPSALVIDSTKTEDGYPRVISLYADQPLNVHQGLEEAYHALEKNLYIAYDTIKDKTKVSNGENDFSITNDYGPKLTALSAAKAAPIAIIRPLIGATEAISKTLLGISNQLDKQQHLNYEDKYKPQIRK